jgi:hypothetical protein
MSARCERIQDTYQFISIRFGAQANLGYVRLLLSVEAATSDKQKQRRDD